MHIEEIHTVLMILGNRTICLFRLAAGPHPVMRQRGSCALQLRYLLRNMMHKRINQQPPQKLTLMYDVTAVPVCRFMK